MNSLRTMNRRQTTHLTKKLPKNLKRGSLNPLYADEVAIMSIPVITLTNEQLNALELFLHGALSPLSGYLAKDDHINVLQHGRLASGHLWPLAFVLPVSSAEKRQALIAGRVILSDAEDRPIAEVMTEHFHQLPGEKHWYLSGEVRRLNKVMHPAFNSIRRNVEHLRHRFQHQQWHSVIAISATPELDLGDVQQACSWLKATQQNSGGMLVQINADETHPEFHQHVRAVRSQIRCSAARQIQLSLLPRLQGLNAERQLILQAIIARNYGATGFLISANTPKAIRRTLLQHRDEVGLDIICPHHAHAKSRSTSISAASPSQQKHAA